jgi:prepilin-type processing-associated H-X9-DG protein
MTSSWKWMFAGLAAVVVNALCSAATGAAAYSTNSFSDAFVTTGRATTNDYFLSYAMNFYLSSTLRPAPHRLPEIPRPSSLVFMADGGCAFSSTVPSSKPYSVQPRHPHRANVTFLDGHAHSFAGDYLGCGVGAKEQAAVHWQTESDGMNHAPIP